MGLQVQAPAIPWLHRFRRGMKNETRWVRCDPLLRAGVLHRKVYDQLQKRIEQEALDTDRHHRLAAGMPVPPLPN
jgi:hypothetical protein